MLHLRALCGETFAFQTTRKARRLIYVLAAALLSGVLLLHLSTQDDWREVAMENFGNVQGLFWLTGGKLSGGIPHN